MLKKICLTLFLLIPALASAGPILITQSQTQTNEGERLDFDFLSLDAAASNNGFVRVASAPGSDFDLSDDNEREYFDLLLDGSFVGRYDCSGEAGIEMSTCNDNDNNNTFDLLLDFTSIWNDFSINVANLILDGMLRVTVDFGPSVDAGFTGLHPENANELNVTLSYNSNSGPGPGPAPGPGPSPVPEPGTLLLLGAGLLGLAATTRRRRRV